MMHRSGSAQRLCEVLRTTLSARNRAFYRSLRMVSSDSMSTSRHKFVVYAPDMTDAGALQRRMSVRSTHLERAKEQMGKGVIKVAGAMLTPESIASTTSEKKMIGSVFICEAESLQNVRQLMESDVYYTSGVWDKEKLTILPLAIAAPLL